MAGLTDDDRARARAEIAEWLRRRDQIPEADKRPIARPERFAGAIGTDDEGNLVTEDTNDGEGGEGSRGR